MKVLLTWFPPADELEQIRAGMPKGTEVVAPKPRPVLSPYEATAADIEDHIGDADVIIGQVMPAGSWDKAKKLKALVWLHTGVQEMPFQLLKQRGIQLANTKGANDIPVAEHAFCLLMTLAKKLIVRHENVLEARWTPFWEPENQGMLLEGRTMAILGLGTIGTKIAKRAKAFGMRVVGLRRHPEKGGSEFVDALYGPKDMHKMLGQGDIIVVVTPLTEETTGFIDDAAIRAMKPTALLINIGRGNLIQEHPLYVALMEKRLGGFASDVWWHYINAIPTTYHFATPSRTNLQHLPNVVCTGDQASRVPETRGRMIQMGIESAAAFIRGEPMPRSVNLDLGY